MASQSLERWALIAEVIGGVAIVISLGVVAYELNKSAQQTAVSSYQELMANITHLNETVIANPMLFEALPKSINDPDSLSVEEERLLFFYYMSIFRHGDMAFFQYQSGAIDQERLDSALRIVTQRLRAEFVNKFWQSQKQLFVQEYQDYIDEFVKHETSTGVDF